VTFATLGCRADDDDDDDGRAVSILKMMLLHAVSYLVSWLPPVYV
jgi:hypothetical protein